jgi:NADH/F420H2 dehydrogenase subunit C
MNFNLLALNNIKMIVKIFPIKKIQFFKDEVVVYIESLLLLNFLIFLKYHTNCQFKILISLSGIDYIKKQNRFELAYDLLSIRYNNRIRIKISINQLQLIDSCENLYSTAGWFESEVFDMFGIFFANHSNLRRILTDYGFEGYPLRKD